MNTYKRGNSPPVTLSDSNLHGKRAVPAAGRLPPALSIAVLNARAIPEAASTFFEQKRACYARFGAASASAATTTPGPADRGELHLAVAFESDTGGMVAGLALYGRARTSPLPLEGVVPPLACFTNEIRRWDGQAVVEFGSFWMDDIWRKTGLSEQIVLAAIAACHGMGTDKIVALAHHHVIDSYRAMGVVPDDSLAPFHYPSPDYVTRMIWADPISFRTLPGDKVPCVRSYASALVTRGAISWRDCRSPDPG